MDARELYVVFLSLRPELQNYSFTDTINNTQSIASARESQLSRYNTTQVRMPFPISGYCILHWNIPRKHPIQVSAMFIEGDTSQFT